MWSSSAHGAVLTPPRALLPTLSAFQLLHPLRYPKGWCLPEAPRPCTVRLLPVLTVSTPPRPPASPPRHRFQQWNARSVAQSHPPRRRPPQPDRHRCRRAFRCNGPILLLLVPACREPSSTHIPSNVQTQWRSNRSAPPLRVRRISATSRLHHRPLQHRHHSGRSEHPHQPPLSSHGFRNRTQGRPIRSPHVGNESPCQTNAFQRPTTTCSTQR